MLQFTKYLAAAAALALAPAAFAQSGHAHGGGGGMAPAAHSMGAAHTMAPGAHRPDIDTDTVDRAPGRHDLERTADRPAIAHRNAHSYGDYRHRGWTQGHHYGWTRHGRHHRPGAMTHTYLSRHDRYRHRHHHMTHHVDRDHDGDNR